MNESLKRLAEQFWQEAKRQGLIIDSIMFEFNEDVSGNFTLINQDISARPANKKGE